LGELKTANVQHSLEYLQEFIDIATIDEDNNDIRETKRKAEYALSHLSKMFNGSFDKTEEIDCSKRARNCSST
jgi:hypothetical protein